MYCRLHTLCRASLQDMCKLQVCKVAKLDPCTQELAVHGSRLLVDPSAGETEKKLDEMTRCELSNETQESINMRLNALMCLRKTL